MGAWSAPPPTLDEGEDYLQTGLPRPKSRKPLSSLIGGTSLYPGAASSVTDWQPDKPPTGQYDNSASGADGSGDTAQPEIPYQRVQPGAASGRAIMGQLGSKIGQRTDPPPGILTSDPTPQTQNAPASPVPPPPTQTAGRAVPPPPDFQPGMPPDAQQVSQTSPSNSADFATQRLEELARQRAQLSPPQRTSNWAQRIGSAIMGVTVLGPFANMILHPKWSQQEAQYQTQTGAIDQESAQLRALENVEGQAEQRRAIAQQRIAQAADYAQREIERQNKIKADAQAKDAADKIKQVDSITKSYQDMWGKRSGDVEYRSPGDPDIQEFLNQGYSLTQDARPDITGQPPRVILVPPGLVKITPQLQQFAPWRQVGESVPWDEHKKDLDAAAKQQQEIVAGQAKIQRPEMFNNVALAIKSAGGDPLNPASITQDIAQRASAQLQHQQPSINLTPEAVQFFAQGLGQGIPMPAMGMGAAGAKAREQIINAAPGAVTAPGTTAPTPLAAGRGTVRADTASLGYMTRMRDAVNSFENTAGKNLDLFLSQAKPVVDSGSPWINQPLRTVARNAVGNQNVPAFDAARQVALTEIAKVVNNPSLSSILSDSARKEVTGLSREDATLGQIYRVASVLRQDMANRRSSLNQSVQDIQRRLGGGAQGVSVTTPDGGVHTFPDQASADAFKRAAKLP